MVGPEDRKRREKRARRAALRWAMRGTETGWSEARNRLWLRWSDDPSNLEELRKLERLEAVVRTLPRGSLRTLEGKRSDASVRAAAEDARNSSQSNQQARGQLGSQGKQRLNRPRIHRRRLACAIVGGVLTLVVVVLALAGGALYFSMPLSTSTVAHRAERGERRIVTSSPIPTSPVVYRTARGEQRTVILEDSTKLFLGGATTVTVSLSTRGRKVVLEAGEVLFEVAGKPQCPFEVETAGTHVTDLGTKFDVRLYRDGQIEVGVTDGAVVVKKGSDWSNSSRRLDSSEPLTINVADGAVMSLNASGNLGVLYPKQSEDLTAWRSGRLIYHEAPLERIIEDLQRNSMWRIELGPDVGRLLFTGLIDENHADQWARDLPQHLPVEVDESRARGLHIRCRLAGCRA